MKGAKSAGQELGLAHARHIDGVDAKGESTNSNKLRDYILDRARAAVASGGVTVNMTVNCLTMPTPAERKRFAAGMAGDMNEAIRLWNRGRV